MARSKGGAIITLLGLAFLFADWYLKWFVFFSILAQIYELATGIDMTGVYIVLGILFIIAFLLSVSKKE
ncbi:MAG: hypothetical protein J7L47_05015 [Candidatus Odinarchaeota archaeon]|nr:hypothetical protein [Candidatus Odinarchaeota archaeon]